MNETEPDIIHKALPVLRIAYINFTKPGISGPLPDGLPKKEVPDEKVSVKGKTTFPEFYQHHIKPKKFDFL